jgi:hypothetical protein
MQPIATITTCTLVVSRFHALLVFHCLFRAYSGIFFFSLGVAGLGLPLGGGEEGGSRRDGFEGLSKVAVLVESCGPWMGTRRGVGGEAEPRYGPERNLSSSWLTACLKMEMHRHDHSLGNGISLSAVLCDTELCLRDIYTSGRLFSWHVSVTSSLYVYT